MKRLDEFESRVDALLDEFADIPHEDLADSLDYFAALERRKNDNA